MPSVELHDQKVLTVDPANAVLAGLRVLFFRPPVRKGTLYFRYHQYAEFLKRAGCDLRIIPPLPRNERGLRKATFFLFRLWRALPEFRRAQLVVLSPSGNVIWTLLLLRILRKRVIFEHYLSYVSHKELFPAFPDVLDRWSFRLVDHVLTHSLTMKDEIVRQHRLDPSRVTALYFGLNLQQFSPNLRADAEDLKRELGLQGKFVIFYHGMRLAWHGFNYLMEAAKRLEDDSRFAFVVMPGDDLPDRPNVVYIRDEQPFDAVPRYLALADVWCSGFDNDPRGDRCLGSTQIQAMAMGLPVVTSPSKEKLRSLHDDVNAVIVAPRSGEAIASAIIRLYNDDFRRGRIGAEARRTAERDFDFQFMEDRLRRIFGGLR